MDRGKLWHKLKNLGLGDEVIRLLQQLYKCHRRKCKTVRGWTKWVECNIGVKQGCVLSPLLFALFIRDILSDVKGGWDINGDRIPGLLFADDLVLIATSEKELQQQRQ